ncbi:MAG: hypothetical protein M1832_001631 [Thelocarpon impressellum]|nr:MAG: hypothetical protein M1832_001631 [Thelocarpon impressellum]
MANNSSLYGVRRQKSSAKEISSSSGLAFSSQLSSLIASSGGTARTSSGRARPSKTKADIFTAHNKDAKKRAAKDLEDDGDVRAGKRQDLDAVDDALLHRSKRKMEEKARLYAAMKRGDYVAPGGDEGKNLEESGLVDFDRKWAEDEGTGDGSESSDGDAGSSEEEQVEYLDEFGRLRKGSRAQAAREERRKRANAADEPDRFSARPTAPANLIYGDTVQAAAFNPDEPVAARIEELARKRDRSPTPPEAVHYDAKSEVRSKGVGFYEFSRDAGARKQEMEGLERERGETERGRRDKAERLERRRRAVEERRQLIREKRGRKEADSFLEGLSGAMGQESGAMSKAEDVGMDNEAK